MGWGWPHGPLREAGPSMDTTRAGDIGEHGAPGRGSALRSWTQTPIFSAEQRFPCLLWSNSPRGNSQKFALCETPGHFQDPTWETGNLVNFCPPAPKHIGSQKWEVRHHPWFKGNHVNESSCPLKVLDCNPFSASTMQNYGKCLSVSTKTCSPGSFPVLGPHPQARWEPAGPVPVGSLHFTISANACRLPPHPSSLCWLSFHPTDPSAEWISC